MQPESPKQDFLDIFDGNLSFPGTMIPRKLEFITWFPSKCHHSEVEVGIKFRTIPIPQADAHKF